MRSAQHHRFTSNTRRIRRIVGAAAGIVLALGTTIQSTASAAVAPDAAPGVRTVADPALATANALAHRRLSRNLRRCQASHGRVRTTCRVRARRTYRVSVRAAHRRSRPYTWTCEPIDGICPRWPSGTTVRWSVDLDGAPAGGQVEAQLQRALGAIRTISGLTFREVAPGASDSDAADIAITWGHSPAGSLAATQVTSQTVTTTTSGPTGTATTTSSEIVRARVTMQRTDDGTAKGQRSAVFLHELMHALGIGHTGDQRSVMYPVMRGWKLSPGDRAALRWAGSLRVPITH